MSQMLAFHRIQKITTNSPDTITTDGGVTFSATNIIIHSLDSLDQPMETQIDLFADRSDFLIIRPE